ncbi:uncharacterized protein [Aegilops tauschii subsp. strangulata]|uniref:uncharacterized protein n=1 Tax=Aegilops tauschii subsp. strangulata TaxID=200361 RepID=UPI003CC84087
MKIVSWNCWGLGNGPTVRSLLELGRVEDPDILFLAETKLSINELERFRWMMGPINMCARNPVGRSRGVALFWRRGVNVALGSYGRRHVDVDVTEEEGSVWPLTEVYGESETERKKETWKTSRLLGQQHQQGRPWLCLGDFNEILTCDEKMGGAARPQQYLDRFREALETCDLGDIGYEGDKFTWRNHSKEMTTYICERLDRATANIQWCEAFLEFSVVNGKLRHSNHRPIIVNTEGEGGGRPISDRGFRFEAWWLQEEGCSEVIQNAWEEGVLVEKGGVVEGMKKVAGSMRKWQKEVVGDVTTGYDPPRRGRVMPLAA